MTRRDLILTAPGVWAGGSAVPFAPGDFWKEKNASDWTDKDIERMLRRSPWAKEVAGQAEFSGAPGGGGGGGRRSGGGGGGAGGGAWGGGGMEGGTSQVPGAAAGGGGWGRGGAGEGEGRAADRTVYAVTVRWESALPVREAKKVQKDPGDRYFISMTGQPLRGFGGRPGGDAPDPARRRALMQEQLKRTTTLEAKGADPIAPEQVDYSESDQTMSVLFMFPRTPKPITLADKEVVLKTRLGPFQFRAKFALKDMVYKGQLEL